MIITLLKPLPGILVELAISWLLLWLIEKRNLGALGIVPSKQTTWEFLIFFLLTACCCSTQFLMRMLIAKEEWQLNPALSANVILMGVWWNLMSVLYEELIFRGAILYILMRRIGANRAIVITSIAFGIYHWFSFGQWGDIKQMAITFVTTGTFGLLLAYAFVRASSLWIPIAIHFGWNLTHGFIFSQGPIGNGIFIPVSDQPKVSVSYFAFYCIMLLPMLIMLFANYFLLRRKRIDI